MFVVRPVWAHYVLWLICAPLFLVEAYALNEFLQVFALQDASRTLQTQAQIVAWKNGLGGPEVRYQFHAASSQQTYTASSMNVLGGTLWVPISQEAWQRAQQQSRTIAVTYLRDNPWINQPEGRVGTPLGDSFLTWGVFVLVDLLWLGETLWIVRNYFVCQAAAERREARRVRFWRSKPAAGVEG